MDEDKCARTEWEPGEMDTRIAILGGGPMGLILAELASAGAGSVALWTGERRAAERLARTRVATVLDRSYDLPPNVEVISSYAPFEKGSWHILAALSSRQFEETMERLLSHLPKELTQRVSIFTKGLVSAPVRKKTGVALFTDYLQRVAATRGFQDFSAAAVNGPSLLQELHDGQYSFFNVGSENLDHARSIRMILETESIHVRASRDRVGVEVAGVLKNPIAIACGVASALPDCGSNFMGELVSVGFREMMRFGIALGANTTTLLGRSGLADVFTTSVSPHSRNRAYGFNFVEELLRGENDPSIMERLQLLVNPARVIEQQVLRSRNLVEGAFALHDILEVARERDLQLPLFSTLFDILSRREHPHALIRLLGREPKGAASKRLPAREKLPGLEFVKGHDFRAMLEQRIQRLIAGTPGMGSRVRRQSKQIASNLEKRLVRSQKTRNQRELEKLPQEIDLWRELGEADHDAEAAVLDELISFYVDEIADDFRAVMRGTLIRSLIPLRFLAGGLRPGAALPYIGGRIDEVRALAQRYNVLYAPTHRSHLDSVEVAFGLQWLGLPVPRYAAGINLMSGPFWSWILKSLGAYAVDREKTRNILYLESLTAYSILMLESGIPSLVYPEGTRSRTGAIEPVKTGLLSTALQAYRFSGREVIIVPVALSYESIPEDVSFCGTGSPSFGDFVSVRRKVYMDLAEPIRVSEHANDSEPASALGRAIEDAWYGAQRVLPNHVVARILVENDLEIDGKDLRALTADFVEKRSANYLSTDPDLVASRGLKILKQRKFVDEVRGRIVGKEAAYLEYYGNMALRRPDGYRVQGVAPLGSADPEAEPADSSGRY